MSKYDQIKDRSSEHFKRLTGVRKMAFLKMAEAVVTHENKRKKISGRPLKLSYGDQVLMTPGYNREYRTYFHPGADYGMSESNCSKLVKKTEDILVISESFRLPERKKWQRMILKSKLCLPMPLRVRYSVLKKDRNFIIQVKKKTYHEDSGCCECKNS